MKGSCRGVEHVFLLFARQPQQASHRGLKETVHRQSSLLDLQLAHMLNMSFYQVVLKGILYTSASFKTKLAYLISRKYGVMSRDDISDPNNNFLYRGYYIDSHPARRMYCDRLRSSAISSPIKIMIRILTSLSALQVSSAVDFYP